LRVLTAIYFHRFLYQSLPTSIKYTFERNQSSVTYSRSKVHPNLPVSGIAIVVTTVIPAAATAIKWEG
jgi:hypothetical protein